MRFGGKAFVSFFFLLLVAIVPLHAGESWRSEYDSISEYSDEPYRRNRVYRVDVADLRPTQFTYGAAEVATRLEKIEDMGKGELRRYLKRKIGAVVIGPGEEFWLVDGHHLAKVIDKAGYEEILVKVLHDWSKLSKREFYDRMAKHKLMWLYDERDRGPLSPEALPKTMRGMKNDPYRSFAYFVRKSGGYKATETPYAEFIWARYFREHLPLEKVRRLSESSIRKGIRLAKLPEARHLPGYSRRLSACSALLVPDTL